MKKTLIELKEATCRNTTYQLGLIELIHSLPSNIVDMVEIGSYQGESTVIFAENIKNIKNIYAIDPWINGYASGDVCSDLYPMEIVENNFDIRTKEFDSIIKCKSTSKEKSFEFENESLDFVYIDGNHSYESTFEDINLWLPKIKKGGVIAGHDYLASCFMGVVNAVNDIFGSPDRIYQDTSWIKFL
jgi:predicted O-methyltransferase YrrM